MIAQTGGPGRMMLGELDGAASPRVERLVATLRDAGIAAARHPDIRVGLWEKFAFICALSGLTALARLPIGPILACPESRALYRGAMAEVVEVARAKGVELGSDCVERQMTFTAQLEPGSRGSLATDLAGGRRPSSTQASPRQDTPTSRSGSGRSSCSSARSAASRRSLVCPSGRSWLARRPGRCFEGRWGRRPR